MTRFGFIRSALTKPENAVRSVIAVAVSVAAASLLRWGLGAAANPVPFVTYFPAIVLCTLFAGWRAGVVAIFLSMAVVNILFMSPRLRPISDIQVFGMMALFSISCLMLVAITQALRNTFSRLNAANERTEFLNQELLHRVRNTLAIVNAVADQTHRSHVSDFLPVFMNRTRALAEGLNVLAATGGATAPLRALVETAVRPFDDNDCVRITGPDYALPGEVCVPLTLALHELCTNAVKYGALSVAGGQVQIEVQAGDPGRPVGLTWTETGGPQVSPPTHRGLGSALLEHPLLGPPELWFVPQGLRCRMELTPLP